jgi:hypothetical protein
MRERHREVSSASRSDAVDTIDIDTRSERIADDNGFVLDLCPPMTTLLVAFCHT